jgi:hypothetical protein
MPLSDDPWIAQNSYIDPERLHALGVITLWWNHCERNLFFLFCRVFNLRLRVGWIIAHDLGDISVSNKMREMMKLHPPESDVADLLKCCLDVYDICRQNRNTLTHFTGHSPSADPKSLDDVIFLRMKGPSAEPRPIPSSLTDIRRVAFEINILSTYLWKTHKAIVARQQGQPATLPPLVAVPELLLKPPPQTPPKPKRPPRPSAASRRKKR